MALLLVPLVSLIAIWAFAAVITGHGVFGLMDVRQVADKIAYPVQETADALAEERRAVLVHLADPANSAAVAALRDAELKTDREVSAIRAASAVPDTRAELDPTSRARLDALVAKAASLEDLRREVDDGKISRDAAFTAYNDEIDPYYTFFLGLNPLQSVGLDRQSRVLDELSRAREAIAREQALFEAAQVAGRLTRADQRAFSDAVSQQRTVYATYLTLLPRPDRRPITTYWKTDSAALALHGEEERILDVSPDQAVGQVTPAAWQASTSSVLRDLSTLDGRTLGDYMKRVRPFAVGVLVKAGIAGGFGLIAVVVSVVVSLRIARGLVRDLSTLRKEAQEASGTRLPRVMRRLAAGETVDIEAEVPRLETDDDEIGAVGKALNTLQRAAVEAAVRQADMRRGVADVFVNLARRNQVLLHRQLTLLDAMERRTEAGDELADLFRLDHMTTRMRRHAEGLVILSGAAPSRQWRKPVPLMDVVRAAVAEVEDYERVEVRRLPRLAVSGSAVADLTHLIAELVENATVFSPPHTTVQVHGERVANGYVLEVDDRGLGMTADTLLDANLRLAETPDFELSDTDRLGLFVVSRLAQRHGVRVSLRNSAYGGTTAVVLIPNALLTDTTDEDTSHTGERVIPGAATWTAPEEQQQTGTLPDEIAVSVAADAPEQGFRDWGMVPTATAVAEDFMAPDVERRRPRIPLRAFDLPEQHHQPAEQTGRPGYEQQLPVRPESADRPRTGRILADGNTPLPRRRRAATLAGPPQNHPAPPQTHGGAGPAGTGQTVARPPDGLPRRVRQASLAPQLRDHDPGRTAPSAAAQQSLSEHDADAVRTRMASLQRGWQRGRAEADEIMTGMAGNTDHMPWRTAADIAGGHGGEATGTRSEGDGR